MKDSGACAIRSSGRDRAVERSVHTQGQRLFLTPTPYQEVVNVRLGGEHDCVSSVRRQFLEIG